MTGYEENPDLSTVATGSSRRRLSDDGKSLHYKLTYSGLEGAVTQAHVHFGKRAINGGVSFFLCGTAAAPGPAGTPACPTPGGTVEGDIDAADVIGPACKGSSPARSTRSSPRCGQETPTRTSTRPSGPAARSAPSSRRAAVATTTTARARHDDD